MPVSFASTAYSHRRNVRFTSPEYAPNLAIRQLVPNPLSDTMGCVPLLAWRPALGFQHRIHKLYRRFTSSAAVLSSSVSEPVFGYAAILNSTLGHRPAHRRPARRRRQRDPGVAASRGMAGPVTVNSLMASSETLYPEVK